MPAHIDSSKLILLILGVGLILPAGCGSGSRVRLTGEVTFEGEPLSRGTIVFTPADPTAGPSTGCDIVDGKYDVPGEMGASSGVIYQVQITALAKSGKFIANPFDPKGPKVELDVNFIPSNYNTHSRLKIKVGTGTNRVDFALKKDGSVPAEFRQD